MLWNIEPGMFQCPERIYIHEDIHDELSTAIADHARHMTVGGGSEQGTDVGPVQNEKQFDRVCELIADARDNGYDVPITILGNPPEHARIVADEQFGPVMPLMKFATVEEAIAGAVRTGDTDKGVEIAEQLETGTVWVNEFLHLSRSRPSAGRRSRASARNTASRG